MVFVRVDSFLFVANLLTHCCQVLAITTWHSIALSNRSKPNQTYAKCTKTFFGTFFKPEIFTTGWDAKFS